MRRKRARNRTADVAVRYTAHGWYIMVGRIAICTHNAPLHLHAHFDRAHPEHQPKIPLDPLLSYEEVLQRVRARCAILGRAPTVEELREVLS